MGDTERLAVHGIEVVALQRLAGCEGDGMHENVQSVPVFAELGECGVDLLVELHVAGHGDLGVELRGELLDTGFQTLVLVGERQRGPLAMHGLGDAPGNGAVPRHTDHERPFAFEKSHRRSPQMLVRCQAGSVPERDGCRHCPPAPAC